MLTKQTTGSTTGHGLWHSNSESKASCSLQHDLQIAEYSAVLQTTVFNFFTSMHFLLQQTHSLTPEIQATLSQ